MTKVKVTQHQWRKLRSLVLARDNYICQLCYNPKPPAREVHHVVPRIEHGSDTPENLVAVHRRCNQAEENKRRGKPTRGWLPAGAATDPAEGSRNWLNT